MARELLDEPEFGVRKPEETVPPEGEEINFHAVWAIEAYTPLHADRLFERLESLGFGREDPWQRGGIRAQLERARGRPRGGTWLNLDHVFPPGTRSFRLFGGIEAPLPKGIRCARPSLHALTPSVTMLVTQFVLDDETATAFNRLSRRTDFKPRTQIRENGVSLTPSDQVKQFALHDLRAELRDRGTSWVSEQVPGVFSSGLGGRPMPSAELVTTELAVPYARGDGVWEYVEFAGLGYDPFHWVSDELEHWRLAFARDEDYAVIAARRPDVIKEKYTQHGDDERWPLTYELHEYLAKDLALWGASHMLLAFHGRLRAVRDHELQRRRLQTASKHLQTIRDEFLQDALDARDAAVELERYADDERRFEWNACEWKASDDRRGQERLLENLRLTVKDNAAALAGAEARLRDGLIVDSSVVGTRAGLRLNWWMLLITLVALVLAIVSLIVASNAGGDDAPRSTSTPSIHHAVHPELGTPGTQQRSH
jgi:hypothetical protein